MPDWRPTFFILKLLTCSCFSRRSSPYRDNSDDWATKEAQTAAEMQTSQATRPVPDLERDGEDEPDRRRAFSGRQSEGMTM